MVRLYSFSNDVWRTRGGTTVDPVVTPPVDPEPDPAPTGWQEAIDLAVVQQNFDPITDWYSANTGHEALGYAEGDLASGSIISQYDGQVIEGITSSHIRVAHNNVTIRGCRIVNGATYGAYLNPTFSAPVTGLVIEYCTLYYGLVAPDNNHVSPAHLHPAYTANPDYDVTIRYCNAYNWSSGFRVANKTLVEYNWVHDMQHPPGVHANGCRPSHQGGMVRRNYLTDGRSGICSIYFDKEPTHDITIEENILTATSPLANPNYLINLKDGDYDSTATNIKINNNMFGPGYQSAVLAGAPVPWGTNGNERVGNYILMSGEPAGNH